MTLDSFYNSLRYQLVEETLQGWIQDAKNGTVISKVTVPRMLNPGTGVIKEDAYFDPYGGVIYAPVYSAKEQGKWKDRPKYDPHSIRLHTSGDKGHNLGARGYYLPHIVWNNFLPRVKNFAINEIEKEQGIPGDLNDQILEQMQYEWDVQFHCDCPAFYWQGMQYNLSKSNSALYPVYTSSPKWDGKHDVGTPICKHLYALLTSIDDNRPYYFQEKIDKPLEEVMPKIIESAARAEVE